MNLLNEAQPRWAIELRNGANSGRFTQMPKDATEIYKGLTYGFYLDIPHDFPQHLLDLIKPQLTYTDFDDGKPLTLMVAMGAESWMTLPAADKKYLANCKLTKAGEAHIKLLGRK
jgi:hypothetical protein